MNKNWKLGDDVHEQDNLLDGFTFEQLVVALVCNEPVINAGSVVKVVNEIARQQLEDMYELVEHNMGEIIEAALDRRN